jgi:single-stranded-DNA-specific exonuclease
VKPGRRAWHFLELPRNNDLERLTGALGVSRLTARVLAVRGLADPDEAQRFLEPRLDELPIPTDLAGLEPALSRLARAVRSSERVAVFGDYDADGVTAAAVAVEVLASLGLDVKPWLANRFEWGYGMPPAVIDQIVDEGRTLALVVDCGTSDVDALQRARERGLDVIVVDHHPPTADLPLVVALINPHREGCGFLDKGLASVGLVFYLMAALRTRLEADLDLRAVLDLVAIGTIADVAPMTRANRTLVRKGLERLGRRARPGIDALLASARITSQPTAEAVAFKLGPRINAAGRLGNPTLALDLLLARDAKAAGAAAAALGRLSRERRLIQEQILAAAEPEALRQAAAGVSAILVAGEGWHQGVIGVVAARFCDDFGMPAGVVGVVDGVGHGSLRAPPGYDLHRALAACEAHLTRSGGHAAAAGFMVKASELEPFAASFRRAIEAQRSDPGAEPAPLSIDALLEPADLTLTAVVELERLGPFGPGNLEPVLAFRGARVVSSSSRKGGHLGLRLDCGGTQVEAFGPAMSTDWPADAASLDVAFHLHRNSYRGIEYVELRLVDLRPAGDH